MECRRSIPAEQRPRLSLALDLPGVSVSLVNSQPRELLYVGILGLEEKKHEFFVFFGDRGMREEGERMTVCVSCVGKGEEWEKKGRTSFNGEAQRINKTIFSQMPQGVAKGESPGGWGRVLNSKYIKLKKNKNKRHQVSI